MFRDISLIVVIIEREIQEERNPYTFETVLMLASCA